MADHDDAPPVVADESAPAALDDTTNDVIEDVAAAEEPEMPAAEVADDEAEQAEQAEQAENDNNEQVENDQPGDEPQPAQNDEEVDETEATAEAEAQADEPSDNVVQEEEQQHIEGEQEEQEDDDDAPAAGAADEYIDVGDTEAAAASPLQSRPTTAQASVNTDEYSLPPPPPTSSIRDHFPPSIAISKPMTAEQRRVQRPKRRATGALELSRALGPDVRHANNTHFLCTDDGTLDDLFFVSGHTGVLLDRDTNEQTMLQGHRSAIVASCASASKRWVATADNDVTDCMLVVWDVTLGTPARLYFADDLAAAGAPKGVIALTFSGDDKFLYTLSHEQSQQSMSVWAWSDADRATPLATAMLPAGFRAGSVSVCHTSPHRVAVTGHDGVILITWTFEGVTRQAQPSLAAVDVAKFGHLQHTHFFAGGAAAASTTKGFDVSWTLAAGQSEKHNAVGPALAPVLNVGMEKLVKLMECGVTASSLTPDAVHLAVGGTDGSLRYYDVNYRLVGLRDSLGRADLATRVKQPLAQVGNFPLVRIEASSSRINLTLSHDDTILVGEMRPLVVALLNEDSRTLTNVSVTVKLVAAPDSRAVSRSDSVFSDVSTAGNVVADLFPLGGLLLASGEFTYTWQHMVASLAADETVHVSVPLQLKIAKVWQCVVSVDYSAPPNTATAVIGVHHKETTVNLEAQDPFSVKLGLTTPHHVPLTALHPAAPGSAILLTHKVKSAVTPPLRLLKCVLELPGAKEFPFLWSKQQSPLAGLVGSVVQPGESLLGCTLLHAPETSTRTSVEIKETSVDDLGLATETTVLSNSLVELGTLVLSWRRNADVEAEAASGHPDHHHRQRHHHHHHKHEGDVQAGKLSVTRVPLPSLPTGRLPVHVGVTCPPSGRLGDVLPMVFTITNTTPHILEYEVSVGASDNFVYSGYHRVVLRVLPADVVSDGTRVPGTRQVRFNLLPLRAGVLALPSIVITAIRDAAVMPVSSGPSHVFINTRQYELKA